MNNESDNYYKQTKHAAPSALLVKALKLTQARTRALDLGAGALKDSRYLVRQGFKEVLAVDAQLIPKELYKDLPGKHFQIIQSSFEGFMFAEGHYDLVNAAYSLPFNLPGTFPLVWSSLKKSIKQDGLFIGQFFGVRDELNVPGAVMTFHTNEEVKKMLEDMEVIECTEIEKDGKTANGKAKHWHTFQVIARKKS